jgi:hypothetical protein
MPARDRPDLAPWNLLDSWLKCDNCVTIGLQICDTVVWLGREHRECGRSIDTVLAFHGRHRGRLWCLDLVIYQTALARKVAIARKQQPVRRL